MIIRAEVISTRGRMVQVKFENGLIGSLPIEKDIKDLRYIEVRY